MHPIIFTVAYERRDAVSFSVVKPEPPPHLSFLLHPFLADKTRLVVCQVLHRYMVSLLLYRTLSDLKLVAVFPMKLSLYVIHSVPRIQHYRATADHGQNYLAQPFTLFPWLASGGGLSRLPFT